MKFRMMQDGAETGAVDMADEDAAQEEIMTLAMEARKTSRVLVEFEAGGEWRVLADLAHKPEE